MNGDPGGSVSVVVPTFNRAGYLREALDSILAQTRPALEVIVVDDGSEDDTPAVAAAYGDRIVYVRKANAGKPVALNAVLPRVRGDYVWLFDDDDVALPESIATRAAFLDRNPDVGFVVTGHFWGRDGDDGRIARDSRYRPLQVPAPVRFVQLLKSCHFTLQSALVRRACYESVGPFDETMHRSEDYEMMVRLARAFEFAVLDEPTFVFRRHAGARGAKGVRHAAADRDRVHLDYDGRLGKRMRESLPLRDYLPGRPQLDELPADRRRLALFTRMSVMASKGLADEAIEDAEDASAIDPGRALDAEERALCAEAMHYMYFWMRVTMDPARFLARAGHLARHPAGRQALRAFAAAMVRHAKSYGDPMPDRVRRLRFAARLALRALSH
jgi:glycosyltransferase involved in cell wall biosynthesis